MQHSRQGNFQLSKDIQSELMRRWVRFTSDSRIFASPSVRGGTGLRPTTVVVQLSRDASVRYYPQGSHFSQHQTQNGFRFRPISLSFKPEYQNDKTVLRFLIGKLLRQDQTEVTASMTLYTDESDPTLAWLPIYNALLSDRTVRLISFRPDEIEYLKHHLGNQMDVFHQSVRNTKNGLASKPFQSKLSSEALLRLLFQTLHEKPTNPTKIEQFFQHQQTALDAHDDQQTYDLMTRLNTAIAQLAAKK